MQRASILDVESVLWYSRPVRTTVSIQAPLLDLAKHEAAVEGLSVSEVIENALRKHLNRSGKVTPSGGLELPKVHGRALRPGLDLDRTGALLAAEDEAAFRPVNGPA